MEDSMGLPRRGAKLLYMASAPVAPAMPRIHFQVRTALDPDAVLAVLTDFGPGRAGVWPNTDAERFRVHGRGPGRADVTEGSAVAGGVWERSRYEWDPVARTVSAVTT